MTKEEALNTIQNSIDRPEINPTVKRQLFSLYKTIAKAASMTTDLQNILKDLLAKA